MLASPWPSGCSRHEARWNAGCSCAACRQCKATPLENAVEPEHGLVYLLRCGSSSWQPSMRANRFGRCSVIRPNLKPGLGLTKTDPGWSAALEAALTAARRDDLEHGTNAAYVSVQGVSGAPAAEDGQTRTKSVPRSSHSVRERLGWCGLRETHGGALGVVCSAVWAWLGRLLRPAALLPATASPRSRMRFMITLGLTNQIIAFACIPPDA